MKSERTTTTPKAAKPTRAALSLAAGFAADDLRASVRAMRKDGMDWDEVKAATNMPVYVLRVIAGETIGNARTHRG